ncbi:NAD(P)/FAD-dependent oxidoreductase [Mesorhizobium hawassense]|uniref:NAD(P)/FAD-dependent oxidoreductase n=1 Tax=Mesorhizobium hawassense TaxID=1209954 RepID=UPI00142D335D|nr:FAD-binding oxidoreductase [Mesorhizobium hawassense]
MKAELLANTQRELFCGEPTKDFTMSTPNLDTSSMDPVLWSKTLLEPAIRFPRLEEDQSADVVVVGAGFCGLNAAIHAARNGASVVLVDARTVGSGASGRNGGNSIPQFPGTMTPSDVASILGSRKARALAELVVAGSDMVFRQAAELQINCSQAQHGWMQPAHSQRSLSRVRRSFEEWQAFGAPVEWHSAADVHDLLGAAGYIGGWSNPTGGSLNPYGLALGLAKAAQKAGVRIFENTAVRRIEHANASPVLVCSEGRIKAGTVLIATGGYTDDAFAGVQRSAIPVYLYQVATKPLRPELREHIMRTMMCFSDCRKSGGFGRLDAEGRIITGGAVFALGVGQRYGVNHCRNRLKLLYPQLTDQDLAFESYWEGFCAISETKLPHVLRLGANIFSITGFSTRGVNLAHSLGRLLGEFAAGRKRLDDIPVALWERRRDVAYWYLKSHAARYAFPWFQVLDRIGLS